MLKYLREISRIPELNGYSLTGLAFSLGLYILIKFAECWILPQEVLCQPSKFFSSASLWQNAASKLYTERTRERERDRALTMTIIKAWFMYKLA